MPGYTGGRIQKIKLKNFMTYDNLTLYPKRGLNLIVGLNGSGKSSIMCAICLGLAGKPQHTGRASHLSDFIKHGHDQAIIELELHRPSTRNVVICRKIKSGNKSEWLLNSEATSLNEITELVKSFNIDTSNLCQFLPQEKVVEFSKMNKRQRLENLLQSIGEPHLFELFNELKDLRLEYCKLQDVIGKLENDKSDQEQKSQRLLPEVERQEERERIKEELKLYERRKLTLQYKSIQVKVCELDRVKKLAQEKIKNLQDKFRRIKDSETEVSSTYRTHMSHLENLVVKIQALNENLGKGILSFTEISGQVHCAKVNFDNKMKEKANLRQKLEGLNMQIVAMQDNLNMKLAENENILEHINAKSQEHDNLSHEIGAANANYDILNMEVEKFKHERDSIKRKLDEMDNEEKKRLNNLRTRDESAYNAFLWLQQNKSRFKSNIYGPIMLVINVNDRSSCKYIENHIAYKDMIAFVCEDEDDTLQLTAIFRELNLLVNIVMTPRAALSDFRSPNIPPTCRRGGLSCFLTDLFSAPDPVLRYLCQIYKIHTVPVSKVHLTPDLREQCCNTFTTFYSKDIKVTAVRSRYGARNLSVRDDVVIDKNLLTVQDDNYLNDQRLKYERVTAEHEALCVRQREYSEIIRRKTELHEQCKQTLQLLIKAQRHIKDMEVHLKQKKESHSKLATVNIDENEEKEKTSAAIQQANYKRNCLLSNQIKLFQDILLAMEEKVKCVLKACSSVKKLKSIQGKMQGINDELNDVREKYNEVKAEKSKLVAQGREMKEKITEFVNFASTLDQLSSNMDEVERKIIHFRTQLNLNSEADQSQLHEYKNLVEQIKNLDKEIDHRNNELSSVNKKIAAKKKEWLPPLESHIHNINKNFSKYFKDLQCAGEISLDTCEGTDDFPNYGLQIRLKYREDEPFMELSQTHHSGGECSVAAIVFILSLQELTEVPFRCIDEINQGMDSVNERKIYQLIADNASEDSNSQYFLLTPKLLLNLPYHQNVGVHILHNSCYINKKIDIKKILQIQLPD